MSRGTYYRICPECGSNLDPGERCTCGLVDFVNCAVTAGLSINDIRRSTMPDKSVNRVCENCKNQRTDFCPNSHLCYSTPDKPYFVKR